MTNDSLHHALIQAADGEPDSVRALLDAGVDPNGMPLIMAIQCGEMEIVQMLLAAGADVNQPFHHTTPLVHAITSGYPDIVALLLDMGADIHQSAPDGTQPLQAAYGQGRTNETDEERNQIIQMLTIEDTEDAHSLQIRQRDA